MLSTRGKNLKSELCLESIYCICSYLIPFGQRNNEVYSSGFSQWCLTELIGHLRAVGEAGKQPKPSAGVWPV